MSPAPRELTDWTTGRAPDGRGLITLVVETDGDEPLAAALGDATGMPSDRHAGTWRAGELGGFPVLTFLLVEEADPGLERAWWTSVLDRALLTAALEVPHDVEVVPAAGDRGLRVVVDEASVRVAELLARAQA